MADKKKCVMLDLDGCAFDESHRRHFALQKDWDSYHQGITLDPMNPFMTPLLQGLYYAGIEVIISTARPRMPRIVTDTESMVYELCEVAQVPTIQRFFYRPDDDLYSPSPEVKSRHIKLIRSLGYEIIAAFDDREDICDMYCENGIPAQIVTMESCSPTPKSNRDWQAVRTDVMQFGEKAPFRKFTWRVPPALIEVSTYVNANGKKSYYIASIDDDLIAMNPEFEITMFEEQTKSEPKRTAADILQEAAATFRERNANYKDNAVNVGKVMEALFPNGVTLNSAADFHIWHLFELSIVKLTRFTNSGMSHSDSARDAAVYWAMIENLIGDHNINFHDGEE